jgi:hypothetical protein
LIALKEILKQKMAKLTKTQWAEARTKWESDPREGFDWLVAELKLDVSRQAVSKTAKAQEWTKKVAQPAPQPKAKVAQPKKAVAKLTSKASESVKQEQAEEPNPVGRPSLYKPEYAELAGEFCLMGATDATLAEYFEVTEQTINNWKIDHPDFFESIKAGKDVADAKVASALFKSATGGHVITEDRLVSDGNGGQEVVTLEKKIEPSVHAQRYWLNNRQPKLWKEKVEAPVEINLNIFPSKEVLDGIYTKALDEAASRDSKLIGRRERLGLLIEQDRLD